MSREISVKDCVEKICETCERVGTKRDTTIQINRSLWFTNKKYLLCSIFFFMKAFLSHNFRPIWTKKERESMHNFNILLKIAAPFSEVLVTEVATPSTLDKGVIFENNKKIIS